MQIESRSNNEPVRLGIIGCGAVVFEYHIPAFLEMPNVVITCLYDRDEKNALKIKRAYGLNAKIAKSVAEFRNSADLVLVAVPPRFHASISLELLEMGIHVLCEKPPATSSADTEKMAEAAERAKRILAIGLVTRFHSNNRIIKKLLQGELLGQIQEIHVESGAKIDWPMSNDSYYNKTMTLGGVFFDSGFHLLDRVIWLLGNLRIVEYEDDSFGGVEANAIARGFLNFDGRDVPCFLRFSWTHRLKNGILVVGSEATAQLSMAEPEAVIVKRNVADSLLEMIVREDIYAGRSQRKDLNYFRVQIEDVVSAIRENRQPFVTVASTVKAMKLIEEAYSKRKRLFQPWVET
jgi:predicted dehydrogenase